MQTPFSSLSFGESFMKSVQPFPGRERLSGIFVAKGKTRKNICKTYTHPPHRRLRKLALINYRGRCIVFDRFLRFLVSFLVYLSARLRDNGSAGPICTKFSRKVWSDHGTTWLHLQSIPRNRAMPRCATRARGLLCFRTTACWLFLFLDPGSSPHKPRTLLLLLLLWFFNYHIFKVLKLFRFATDRN